MLRVKKEGTELVLISSSSKQKDILTCYMPFLSNNQKEATVNKWHVNTSEVTSIRKDNKLHFKKILFQCFYFKYVSVLV